MTEPEDKKKSPWKLITATVATCAVVFAFIYTYTVNIKDARIELLQEQVETLKTVGEVPDAVRDLESKIEDLQQQLRPLTLVTKIDPITGRCDSGMMSFGTELTEDLIEAQNLIKDKKYDIALAKAKAMEEKLPGFAGAPYIRFKVNEAKGYQDEAASDAHILIEALPEDKRIQSVRLFLVNHLLSKGQKKEAEESCLKAIALCPDDDTLRNSFVQIFGYEPSIGTKTTE